jgi:flagellar biosynthesis protein FlhB
MSETSGQKKHEAPPAYLEKQRRAGESFYSQELSGAAVFLAVAVLFAAALPSFSGRLIGLSRSLWDPALLASSEPLHASHSALREAARDAALLLSIALVPVFVVTLLAGFLQVGPVFTTKKLWAVGELNPAKGFQGIFLSKATYVQLAIGAIKAVIMLAVVAAEGRSMLPNLIRCARLGGLASVRLFGAAFGSFLMTCSAVYLVFGFVDYLVQRRDFIGKNRLTDEELRNWIKETEGNVETRMRLRFLRRIAALAMERKRSDLRNARNRGGLLP